MKMGSLFAGIGGFDLGFQRAGFTVAWHAEIDKAASRILAFRWPGVPNLGDVTKINGAAIEAVDVICGGFPYQDLSVAGKRRGFAGERSVLAFEFLRIVREMKEATDGRAPTFVVLENVPGLFSSSGGRDFGALLDALGELGALDIAWRVLDSRYFGVAQRRRRVFIVVDFGGERCDEILALREGLRGDSPKGRAAREEVAGTLGGGAQSRGWSDDLDRSGAFVTMADTMPTLVKSCSSAVGNTQDGFIVAHTLRADGFDAGEDGTGRGTPLVVADTVRSHPRPGSNSCGLVIPFDTTQITSAANYSRPQPGDPSHPLAAGAHAPAIAFNWQNGGGYGDANDGLAVTVEGTPPQSRSQVAAVAFQLLMHNNGAGGNRQILGIDEPHPTLNLRQPNAVAFHNEPLTAGRIRPILLAYADATQTYPHEVLRSLREAVGSEEGARRGLGILAPFLTPEVLREDVLLRGPGSATRDGDGLDDHASEGAEADPAGAVRQVRSAESERRSPPRRGPHEQCPGESGTDLPLMPYEGASTGSPVLHLWDTPEGARLLREALSAVQEVGQSATNQAEPASPASGVRRLTPREAERLQGFPDDWTAIPDMADGPRYKCLGNAVTVNVANWIANRIMERA